MPKLKKNRKRALHQQTNAEQSEKTIHLSLLAKFKNFMNKQRNDQLRKGLNNLYGRHYPINYSQTFCFREQWQSKKRFSEQIFSQQIFQSQTKMFEFYNLFLLFFYSSLLWYSSLFRITNLTGIICLNIISFVSFVIIAMDCCFHLISIISCIQGAIKWTQIVKRFSKQAILLSYLLFNIGLSDFIMKDQMKVVYYPIDIFASCLLFKKAKGLFRHFKIKSYSTSYKYEFKLIDLLVNLLIIQHLFAILLYAVSFYDENNNWVTHIGKESIVGIQRFFYAFYFTSTTMLTIGYGDIIPINQLEIFTVLIIQIFGVAIFSYVINDIGFTLSSIRKEEDQLEHSIFTLAQMGKYYNLEPDLTHQAKSYLINNQRSVQTFYPVDEKEVLSKLNDDLRDAITQENHLNLIKSSLFFVCHWSKRFQIEIAKRLQKKILNPNELILQNLGRQSVYIVRSGKLQIYTNNHFGYKKHFKKLLKTIEPKPNAEVCDNIYGYTSIFTSRSLKFNAISKQFTCVYSIDKKKFLECVNNDKMDIQYYFQVKAKIQASKFYEAWEAPAILNIREHYRPNQIFLIKRQVLNNKKSRNNRQIRYSRKQIRLKRYFMTNELHKADTLLTQGDVVKLPYYVHQLSEDLNGRLKPTTTSDGTIDEQQFLKNYQQFLTNFQAMKEYHRYFLQNNMSNVLKKMEISNPCFLSQLNSRNQYQSIKTEQNLRQINSKCTSLVSQLKISQINRIYFRKKKKRKNNT